MNESLNRTELSRLIIESLEGGISTERFTLLDRILAEDLDAVEYYNNFLDVYACLKKNGDMFADNFSNSSDTELDMEVWKALAHVENTANVVHIEKVPEETQLISIDRSCVKKVEHTVSKFFLVTAITSSAAMLFILLLVLLTPDAPPVVARLTDAVGVVWNDAELPMAQGSELRARNVTLLDGFAEVEFNDGAVVVIEAPAEFDLE
ncbi:MAG: hypothetical protein KAS23_07840, partial [Anaerohalosphaera sp.]|nr:hypothetical protein [Anaerohalosphaera sp.]